MKIKRYNVPKTRDPFANTPLIRAGYDPDTGEERFWTSTWNANVGMTGALVTPSGKCRVYRFEHTKGYAGFGSYTAVYVGDETMWLLSDTSVIRRFDLRTGKTEDFETGAKQGLVFPGMPYDEKTGKLLFFSNVTPGVAGVSFDTKTGKTAKLFSDFTAATGVRGGFLNPDGTHTLRFVDGDPSLWRWNPETDELVRVCDTPYYDYNYMYHRVSREDGRYYVPYIGWFDGYTAVRSEPEPEMEMHWFGKDETYVYGLRWMDKVYRWELATGKVEKLCEPSNLVTANLTSDGDILLMSVYGTLQKYNKKGDLLLSKVLDTSSYGTIDCITATDNGKIIGTPFITQLFWVVDEESGEGFDAGKATPGGGEVLKIWNKGGKVYMASYTQGYMTEYDPTQPTTDPHNPRVVAKPPEAMRPYAAAEDERCIYYSSNHEYGHLGCVMTKYDITTGEVLYLDNPMEGQAIWSMYRTEDALWSGTTWQSDCRSIAEPSRDCYLLKHDPETLEVTKAYLAPAGLDLVNVCGETEGGLLVRFHSTGKQDVRFACFDPAAETFAEFAAPIGKVWSECVHYTGRKGEYILLHNGKIERWMIAPGKCECVETILEDENIYRTFFSRANGEAVLCAAMKKEFYVIRDFLK